MPNLLTQILSVVGAATGVGSIAISWYLNTPKIELEDSFVLEPDTSIKSTGKGTYQVSYVFRNRRGGDITLDVPRLRITTSVLKQGKIEEYSSTHNPEKSSKFLEIPARGKVKIDVTYNVSAGKLVRQNYENTKLDFLFTDNRGKQYVHQFSWGVCESDAEDAD